MEFERQALLMWSEFVKITKFGKRIGVSAVAISNYLKYGTKSISDKKIKELYNEVLNYMRENFA